MNDRENKFGVWDYVVFVAMLVISVVIGLVFAIGGKRQRTQGEYFTANRSLSVLPVAISMLVSYLSAILVLGVPAEVYTQSTEYYLAVFGNCIGIILAAVLFVPLLHPLKITSAYEYLEKRYKSKAPKLTATLLMIIVQILYMGIASFAPSTALEAVTGFPTWGGILIIGAAATFYTSIGGMVAVVWTDVFQALVMLAGMLAVIIQASYKVGGMSRVWEINYEWERIRFFTWDPDPTVRHSVWSLVIGSAVLWFHRFAMGQQSVQRYSSLSTITKAKIAVLLNALGHLFLFTIACLSGIALFAYYANKGCDPISTRVVGNPNQLIAYFVMETLDYPGVPGLFISCLFAAALSTVSSSLNALAAVTWEDILKHRFDNKWSEATKIVVIKVIVLVFGCCAVGMSFIAMQLDGTVLQAVTSLLSIGDGPLLGMFVMAAFLPWTNKYGAVAGGIIGAGMTTWLCLGQYVTGIPKLKLPNPNGTCLVSDNFTSTASTTTTTTTTTMLSLSTSGSEDDRSPLDPFYSISYLWIVGFGALSCVVAGVLVSLVTGLNCKDDVPVKYQIPLFSRLFCCLPDSWLYKLNCCREFDKTEDIHIEEKSTEMTSKASSHRPVTDNGKEGLDNIVFQDSYKKIGN